MTNDFNYSQGNVQESKKRGGFGCCGILVLMVVVFILASCFINPVQAQTETPTPEPTADVVDEIEIDGETFAIEKTVSYGDIAVVVAIAAIITIFMIYAAFQIITHYLR